MQALVIPFQLLTYVMMLLALYAIFIYAPVEKTMGAIQKIFYIHVPAAFLAYLAFLITFLASVIYLIRKDSKWDTIAHCAVETGVIYCTIVLITGPIWAKPVWNVWWTWDPRLTNTDSMVYLCRLFDASQIGERKPAREFIGRLRYHRLCQCADYIFFHQIMADHPSGHYHQPRIQYVATDETVFNCHDDRLLFHVFFHSYQQDQTGADKAANRRNQRHYGGFEIQ